MDCDVRCVVGASADRLVPQPNRYVSAAARRRRHQVPWALSKFLGVGENAKLLSAIRVLPQGQARRRRGKLGCMQTGVKSEAKRRHGGEAGIRTLGALAGTQHFQCCTIGRSVTSPNWDGRGERIRTSDLLLPKQPRCQTALRPGHKARTIMAVCRLSTGVRTVLR